jgi:hypothetical protein
MGLQEELKEIKDLLKGQQEGVKEKKWKFPFGKKVGRGQRKKNFITVLEINENGSYHFRKFQIEDQTVMVDLIPRLATAGHVIFDKKGNPLIILPSWSVEPFSPLQHFNQSLENGSNVNAYRLLMAKMQKEMVSPKKQVSGILKWIIGLALLGIIIFAVVTSGG